ncbi:non-structural maintenance of chromosomes element 1 homolog isoform X2 [Dendronephthya gigantea]|uniref:non-structural maintenance of chromosomes element 1 homolog isoform X2 n=1 Tax=Dendronephthya gigantea TaxID=151771 RepID=UPI001069BBB1|nr:non-structural maintenance of chromosomes element 1 homolog isoform X2 [Dendronephthya gigantea]
MQKSHRLYLQCFMARPFMSEKEAKESYSSCVEVFQDNFDPANFQRCINTINNALQPLFLEIRKGVSEDDGKYYYGLVNSSEDQISKLATSYTAHDVEYFRKVLDTFVQSDDGTATSVELLHGAADLQKSMSASHAEKLLNMWVKGKWLSQSLGDYWLGPRAVLELQPYLKRVYEDYVMDCKICMDFVLRGQSCVACDFKIHHHCAARYFKGRSVRKCSNCNIDWPHEIDETLCQNEADTATNSQPEEPRQSSNVTRPGRKRTRR